MWAATKDNLTLIVEYDTEPMNPREDWDNFGKMVCWHNRYNLGDEHNHQDPEDFLAQMVAEQCDPLQIFRLIKAGKCRGVRLRYDRSDRRWVLESAYNGKWFREDSYPPGLSEKALPAYFVEKSVELLTISEKHALLNGVKGLILLPLYLYDHSGITMSASPFSCPWDSGQVGWTYCTPDAIREEYGELTNVSVEKARQLLLAEVDAYDLYLRGECYSYTTYLGETETNHCGGFLGNYDDFLKDLKCELGDGWAPLADDLAYCNESDVANYFWSRRAVI